MLSEQEVAEEKAARQAFAAAYKDFYEEHAAPVILTCRNPLANLLPTSLSPEPDRTN
jgi:hypothetical protein